MLQNSLSDIIRDQTDRALWEIRNVIACLPDRLWEKPYCDAPLWQHIYHMLHSLDQWYINPFDPDWQEPDFHVSELNNLDVRPAKKLSRAQLDEYGDEVCRKVVDYTAKLTDDILMEKPKNSEFTRFALILGQFRHLHSHMGMLMGFLIAETGDWPYVLGLTRDIPDGGFGILC